MIFNILIILFINIFANTFMVSGYDYLNNNISSYHLSQLEIDFWFDSPLTGYHNSYPPVGINCIATKDNYSYMISSQSRLTRHSVAERCQSQKRTVSVFKKNVINSMTEGHLVLGESYSGSNTYKCYRWNEDDMNRIESVVQSERPDKEIEICTGRGFYWRNHMTPLPNDCHCGCCQKIIHPVGGKGSDDVTSCGIDSISNILYYIGGNYQNCPDNYHTQPSIVRINLTNFKFIDRTLLSSINGFNSYGNWSDYNKLKEKRYFNYPSASTIYYDKIILTFNSPNSGFWEISFRDSDIRLINSFQKKIFQTKIEIDGNSTKTVTYFEYMSGFTKTLQDTNNNKIHFISESSTSNARVLTFNMSQTDYYNNSTVTYLNGINDVMDLKMDYLKNRIYLLSGTLSSKLFKFDPSFNLIPVSTSCNVVATNFPVSWKNANSFILDQITGTIYLFFVSEPFTGYSILKTNTMTFSDINRLYFNRKEQLWTPIFIETASINHKHGKIIIANKANENSMFVVYGEITLQGCAEGRKRNNYQCDICPKGTYTDIVGSDICSLCDFGHSTISEESKECMSCNVGKYANNLGSTSCQYCPTGKFSENSGSSNCNNCNVGRYNSNIGSTSPSACINCDEGKYSNISSSSCSSCMLGEYVDLKERCLKCPRGRYSEINRITTKESCKFCPRGKYSNILGANSSDICISCPPGMYSNTLGGINNNVCIECNAGRFKQLTDSPGIECMICDDGKYSANRATICIECPKGKYNFGTHEDDHKYCLDCPVGKFNQMIGGDNINNCLNCPLGKFSNIIGLNNSIGCNSCNVGKYNEIIGSTQSTDCVDCPAGKIRKFVAGTSINDCIDCATGYFSNGGSFECKECLAGKYNNINGNNICLDCTVGMYNNNTKSITCNDCPDNSESNIDFTKCECIKGTYMVSKEPLVCNICPENFECPKGSTIETIIVLQKFWRANSTTLHTERCKKAYNCPGGMLNTSSNDLCNVGHTGPICDVCLDGWAKNEGKCFKCMTDDHIIARSYTFTVLFPLIIAAIIFFMIKTANPSSSTAQKEPLSGVIKIFMNYAQIFTLASSFEINWPEIILRLFDRTKEFSSPRISFYSSDCTIGWDYYTKLLAYMILPLGYILAVTLILSVYTFIFYKKNRNKIMALEKWENDNDKRKYYNNNPEPMIFFKSWMCTSILIGLFLAWPTIIKQSLSIIPCKKYGNNYYLLQDLSIECYTTEHNGYSIMSYIFLAIYGFIVPIVAYFLIRGKRFSLYDFNSKYEMPAPLSFLFLGYREQVWYYEFIVMAKKYVLILITVFLKEYSRYQMISASLFIQVSFFIHVFLRPYDGITNYGILCNKLESISLLALVVTLNSGLFFGTIDQQYDLGFFEMVLIGILFAMNAIVVIYFLYYLLVLGFNEAVDLIKKLIKSLDKDNSCCLNCLSLERREKIVKWSRGIHVDTYGIKLESEEEIELFHHFFNDKKMFSHQLKHILKDKKLLKFNHLLNRIRSNIEIIEKQRCWLSVLNNRLYKKLRKELLNNKDKIESRDINKLNDILGNYVKNGLKYSKTIDRISEKALVSIRRNSIMLESIYEDTSENDTSENDTSENDTSENDTSDDSEVEEIDDVKNIII